MEYFENRRGELVEEIKEKRRKMMENGNKKHQNSSSMINSTINYDSEAEGQFIQRMRNK